MKALFAKEEAVIESMLGQCGASLSDNELWAWDMELKYLWQEKLDAINRLYERGSRGNVDEEISMLSDANDLDYY